MRESTVCHRRTHPGLSERTAILHFKITKIILLVRFRIRYPFEAHLLPPLRVGK